MSDAERLVTSPLLFGHRGSDGRLIHSDARDGRRFRLSGERAAAIVLAFVEARSPEAAVADGFTPEELEQAQAAGILVTERECEEHGLWERNGWSRSAHLLFSQMDIPYIETDEAMQDRATITDERRSAVDRYRHAAGQPTHGWLASGEVVALPGVSAPSPRLVTMTERRSVRGFSTVPPDASQLAAVLHAGTAAMRTADADRADGDPFRLLNSFYSWAHVFVVVQAVDGVPPGAFEYDWGSHQLLRSANQVDEAEVLACIQGQRGVLGTGFVVFIVADLRRYAWLYRHSRAYLHVLIQIGELGQELLMAAGELGLGGWPSPAVHESRAASVLGLDELGDDVEVLSILKLGRPNP